MKLFMWLLLCALVACSNSGNVEVVPGAPTTVPKLTTTVDRVVDGDTIIARGGTKTRTRIRLIGIDTPETVKPNTPVQCYGPEASAYLKKLLPAGEDVRLEYDRDRTDRYGRTLAYVYRARDNLFVNLDLVERGYARILDIPPDDRYAARFAAAAVRARASLLGLWGACALAGNG